MKIILYPHGGSGNHGCEALVRATKAITRAELTLFTTAADEDSRYGLDREVTLKPQYDPIERGSVAHIAAMLRTRIMRDTDAYDRLALRTMIAEARKGGLALSIGGDNYCYGVPRHIMLMNRALRRAGVSTVLWGCSIDPEAITGDTLEDLRGYSGIIARESLTASALAAKGINSVVLLPDPAFVLPSEELALPDGWVEGNTVGINLSPMVMGLDGGNGLAMRNYEALIEHILSTTDMTLALIPHVVWSHNDDRVPLRYLYEKYRGTGRVLMVDDHNACQLKGLIARCRFMVAARTHASIAAYSSCVPTLVTGYSVKAKGIATDLFGDYHHYVVPVQSLTSDSELARAFDWLLDNETAVGTHLRDTMPAYSMKAFEMNNVLQPFLRS